jgi:uncharacterized protein YkwD
MGIPTTTAGRRSGTPARRILVSVLAAALAVAVAAAPSYASAPQHSTAFQSQRVTVQDMHRWAVRMLGLLNQERHSLGRRPLTMNAKLVDSAHGHTLRMARRNVLSHQLPGEPVFYKRMTNAGYHWRAAGENIGETSVRSLRGLFGLEKLMFHEKPPSNGHRLNIISRSFRNVGIDVIWDSTHHTLWFTQDFGQPA